MTREPDEIVGGCIAIYKNVWQHPNETIQNVEKSGIEWQSAKTINGDTDDLRTNQSIFVSETAASTGNVIMQGIHDNFMEILTPILYGYAKMFNIVDNLQLEGITLLKYSQLQYYAPHYDTHPDAPRVLSAICYMNDDYEGGELEFINFNIKIKPEPGMLVLFPSNFAYTHTAHPVTSGFKYSLVTWLRDQQYTIS